MDKDILFTEGLKQYLLRDREKECREWIDEVYAFLPKLSEKWEIRDITPFQRSRYGLVLDAPGTKYGDAVIKLIPPFLNRYERELEAMSLLPGSTEGGYMCALYDHDGESHALLLEKVRNASFGTFDKTERLKNFYALVFSKAKKVSEAGEIKYLPDYHEELIKKQQTLPGVPYMKEEAEKALREATELFEEAFSSAEKYVIHRDLHQYNLLDDGVRFYGVDPVGNRAPVEFECVRYMRNDMRDHPEEGYLKRFETLMEVFGRYADPKKIAAAFIIDGGFHVVSSTYENALPTETLFTLDIMEAAKEFMNGSHIAF